MATKNNIFPEGKIAIVTGGSRGLGRNTVVSLAERGVSSIFTFNSNRAEAEKVVGLVTNTGATAIPIHNLIPVMSPYSTRLWGAFETGSRSLAVHVSTTL